MRLVFRVGVNWIDGVGSSIPKDGSEGLYLVSRGSRMIASHRKGHVGNMPILPVAFLGAGCELFSHSCRTHIFCIRDEDEHFEVERRKMICFEFNDIPV